MYFLHFVTKVSKEGGGVDFPYVSKIHIWNYFHCHKDLLHVKCVKFHFTSQYKRPPIDDFVELIIENLEK